MIEFIKQIEESIPTLQLRREQIQAEENVSFFKWLKEQLSGNIRYSSLEEIKKIEFYLTHTVQKLYAIHKVSIFRILISQNIHVLPSVLKKFRLTQIPPFDSESWASFGNNSLSNAGDAYSSFSSFDSYDNISNSSPTFLNVREYSIFFTSWLCR